MSKRDDEKIGKLQIELKGFISDYLKDYVLQPALELADDPIREERLSGCNLLIRTIVKHVLETGTEYDKEFLRTLPKNEIEARLHTLKRAIETDASENDLEDAIRYLMSDSSRKYLFSYLDRELHWVIVTIYSASYISALIHMRAIFELIVGIVTRTTGKMGDRIDSISFLTTSEKKNIKISWYRLCAWGHPYGRWIKEVCPVYVSVKPIYHTQLFDLCITELEELIDLLCVVAFEKYEIAYEAVIASGVNIDNYKLSQSRLAK